MFDSDEITKMKKGWGVDNQSANNFNIQNQK